MPAWRRTAPWLTGSSGSAGVAIVLSDRAAIFVDGRYTLQAPEQVDVALFTPQHLIDAPPTAWIEKNLKAGGRLEDDPWLHTPDAVARSPRPARRPAASLVAVDGNPIDAVWTRRPAAAARRRGRHKPQYWGKSRAAKIARVRAALEQRSTAS